MDFPVFNRAIAVGFAVDKKIITLYLARASCKKLQHFRCVMALNRMDGEKLIGVPLLPCIFARIFH